MLSFGGCLHFIHRCSCCCYCSCYASFNAGPLPPPLGLDFDDVLGCCAFVPQALVVFTTLLLPATNQRFSYCSAASSRCLNHLSETFAASIHCFALMGKVKRRNVALDTTHPVLFLPSQVTLFPPAVPLTSLVGVASRCPYEPQTPPNASCAFVPSSRRSHRQSVLSCGSA